MPVCDDENDAIKRVFVALGRREFEIPVRAADDFPGSVVLQYYKGVALSVLGRRDEAICALKRSMALNPDFAPAALEAGKLLIAQREPSDAQRLLIPYLEKKTMDATSHPPRWRECPDETMQIVSLFESDAAARIAVDIFERAWARFERLPRVPALHVKHLALRYGAAVMRVDPALAHGVYHSGLRHGFVPELDRPLYQGAVVSSHYVARPREVPYPIDRLYPVAPGIPPVPRGLPNVKVRVAYMSPDLNKNAVGLFAYPLLRYFDPRAFDVFVLYINKMHDQFTPQFLGCPVRAWIDAADMSDDDVAALSRALGIHIFVDLIGHGVGGRLGVVAGRPAPVIVNYCGYPDSVGLSSYSYRITDIIADPEVDDQGRADCETRLYLPGCFLCYHMFESVVVPPCASSSREQQKGGPVHVGIFNRAEKHSSEFQQFVRELLRNPSIVLHVKLDSDNDSTCFGYIPHERKVVHHHAASLPEYLELFNKIDVSLDTFPYSGTATTCSSLLMGVPVVTLYARGHRHVSNVSASILSACGLSRYIASSLDEVRGLVVDCETSVDRLAIRRQFLASMDATRFMKKYEDALLRILRIHDQ